MASSSSPPASNRLPPGFRFRPTDQELVGFYLTRKVAGRPIQAGIIAEVDLYKCEPWDLPDKSSFESDVEWYFFSPRDKKYPNGSRTNRATESGYWKATGKDRVVRSGSKGIGMKKTLVFYKGRAPHGKRTEWIMHEYRLEEGDNYQGDGFVVCRVFKKSAGKIEEEAVPTYLDEEFDQCVLPSKADKAVIVAAAAAAVEAAAEPEPEPETEPEAEVVQICSPASTLAAAPEAIVEDDSSLDAFLMMLLEEPAEDAQTLGMASDEQDASVDYQEVVPDMLMQPFQSNAQQSGEEFPSSDIMEELLAGDFIEMNDFSSGAEDGRVDKQQQQLSWMDDLSYYDYTTTASTTTTTTTQQQGGGISGGELIAGIEEDEDGVDGPLRRFLNMLGSVHVLPASAAEHPKQQKIISAIDQNLASSSQLTSMNVHVTVTCRTRSHHPKHVVKQQSQPQPQEKKSAGNRNLLFVFLVGSMSALFWILLLPGMSKLSSYVNSALLI